MIQSMTGFGKSQLEDDRLRLNVEIKCLNSKQLDIICKCPGILREKELEIRGILGKGLKRGKVEINIYYENLEAQSLARLDRNAVEGYLKQLKEMKDITGPVSNDEKLKVVMSLPDVLKSKKHELAEERWKEISSHIVKAMEQTIAFRDQEGQSLEKDLDKRIGLIAKYMEELTEFEESRLEKVRTRLQERIKEHQLNDIDNNRFEQELIFYLEKLDVTEEKTRLANHLKYFRTSMDTDEPAGKKLGFIIQEIGREINTLGSKANDSDIQKKVVMMKDELEKIREQTLNVL